MKHKWHKEIKAWADGAEIESRYIGKDKDLKQFKEWSDEEDLGWDVKEWEFRIKPQPKKHHCIQCEQYRADIVIYKKIIDEYKEELTQPKESRIIKEMKEAEADLRKSLGDDFDKKPQYLYVYYDADKTDFEFWDKTLDEPIGNKEYIGKIKLEVEDER